ncbi:hypothetical protein Tco_0371819 [Tanacetum coccineum]
MIGRILFEIKASQVCTAGYKSFYCWLKKLLLLKIRQNKLRDYDLWSMRMEQYLTHTNYALWEVIVNGDAPAIASASASTEGLIPPKTAKQKLARKNN